ncbi:AfsR/SARP family transcriptional regulator [Amycolatopsis albispora]|uniref:AfsR/SARP family transcriptional regulator n=1 Tax=Amycolatopsis albispora TaxID=1804986 RepID=UPI0013B41D34|nr:AfsR/SARP family transcriptional regulator [Amycolatopsis albispora]
MRREHGLGTPKQRTVLSALLLNANHIVSVDQLTTVLWDGRPPRSAMANVYSYVAGVRRLLDGAGEAGRDRLITRMPGYVLRVRSGELDLSVFDQLAHRGQAALRRSELELAADCLGRALAVWRGRPLEDVRVTSALMAPITALEGRRIDVLNDLIQARLRLGQHKEVVGDLRELIALAPLSELTWSQFMFALYRSGRKAEALGAFLDARRTMISQAGVEPSAYLRRVHQAMLTGTPSAELLEHCWRG